MPPSPGYWGKTSATIDWCEENYVVTHYIAEFWNTISNVIMIVPPLLAAILATCQKLENRMVMSLLSLTVVGIGSWCFHMTLRYGMQLLDELPMIWGSAVFVFSIIEIEKPLHSRSQPIQVGLLVYCSVITLVYLIDTTPLILQIGYGAMVTVICLFGLRLVKRHSSRLNLRLYFSSLITYVLAVVFWLIDTNYCSHIRKLRSDSSVGAITQLHAWWHILAGLGTYLGIIFFFHSRYVLLKHHPQLKFWKGVWPYIDVQLPLKTA